MGDLISVRRVRLDGADDEAVARLHAAVPPGERIDFEPRTAAALRAFDAVLRRGGHALERRVAEEAGAGRIVGCAQWFERPWSSRPGCYWLGVRCDPAFRRRGVGGRLYAEAEADLARRGGSDVWLMVRETTPGLLEAAARRGFRELLRSWEYVLDLGGAGATGGRGEGARPRDRGPGLDVEIVSLPALKVLDLGWLLRLCDLYGAVNREVPLPNHPEPVLSPEALVAYLEGTPASLPEACFVARRAERLVGLCVMHRSEDEPDTLNHLFTGVDPAYRGRGVARALKLRTLDFGRRHGYARIRAAVESNNPGMLALNDALGFRRCGGAVVLERALSR